MENEVGRLRSYNVRVGRYPRDSEKQYPISVAGHVKGICIETAGTLEEKITGSIGRTIELLEKGPGPNVVKV